LPVTVVSVGAGMSYGNLGYSHHAVEDIGILRGLPGMRVLSPADPGETRGCLQQLVENPGPSYLRLGKAGEPDLHAVAGISPAPLLVRDANADIAIIATGSILKEALRAAETLKSQGQPIAVWSCPWLSPVGPEDMRELCRYRWVFTAEEHRASTGLGAVVRENLPSEVRIHSFGVESRFSSVVGTQEHLRLQAELDGSSIARQIVTILKANPSDQPHR
jgi:transketolase